MLRGRTGFMGNDMIFSGKGNILTVLLFGAGILFINKKKEPIITCQYRLTCFLIFPHCFYFLYLLNFKLWFAGMEKYLYNIISCTFKARPGF